MSIVKMNKISLIGLESDKDRIMENLMKMGVVDISDIDQTAHGDEWHELVDRDGSQEEVAEIDNKISRVKSSLDYLLRYDKRKKGLFNVKRAVTSKEYTQILDNEQSIWTVVDRIGDYDSRLSVLRAEKNRLLNLSETLKPWEELTIPVDTVATKSAIVLLGVMPAVADIVKLEQELSNQIRESYLKIVNRDKDQSYILVISHISQEENITGILKQYGFNRTSFKDLKGTAKEIISDAASLTKEIEREREKIESEIAKLADYIGELEVLHDYLNIMKDRKDIQSKIVKTEKVFLLGGWLPEELGGKVKAAITQKYQCYVDIKEPEKDEEYPILLRNTGIARSVESITGMYSVPSSKEIDPNIFMAPFFIMFFGLMLSDAGYGLILALGGSFILYKYKLEEGMRKFVKLMVYCGIATIFWGALFGGWFGDTVAVITGKKFSLGPLWFDPIKQPEKMLKWSLTFGVIHIFVGIAVRGINLIRQKKYLDAVLDALVWYVFLGGAVLYLLPYVPDVDVSAVGPYVSAGSYMLMVGAVLLVLTNGRNEKGIAAKAIKGISGLYDLVGFMSDVLSYSRLLALGLATSVIASIVNQMGALGGLKGLGVIAFIVVFVLGHTFNFLINALGAYVHSSRLQYIEFFGKFYKGGGKEFKPFKLNTKYIELQIEEDI